MGVRRKEYTAGMAFGHNAAFLQNPFGYIQKNPINQQDLEGFAWKRADASARQKEDARVIMQTLGTELSIDLLYTGNKDVLFCLCDARFPAPKETPINVYWVPFKTGKLETLADIGFADVPKQNPAYDFVFTPGMNGCSSLTMELSSKRSFRRAIPLDGYLKFESHRRVFQDDSVLSSKKKAPQLPKRSAEV
jgi:hypothetical protein